MILQVVFGVFAIATLFVLASTCDIATLSLIPLLAILPLPLADTITLTMADNTYFEDVPAAQLSFSNKKFDKISKEEPLKAKNLIEVYKVLIEMVNMMDKKNITAEDMEIVTSRLGSIQLQHVHTTGLEGDQRKSFMRYVMLRMEEEFTALRNDNNTLKEEMEKVNGSNQTLEREMKQVKDEMTELKDEVTGLKDDVTGLKEDVTELKGEMEEIKVSMGSLNNSLQTLNTTVTRAMQKFNERSVDVDEKFDDLERLNRIVHAKAFNQQFRRWNRRMGAQSLELPLKAVEGRGEGFLDRSEEYQQQQEAVPIGRRPQYLPSRAHNGVVPPSIFQDLSVDVLDKMAIVYNDDFGIDPEDHIVLQRQKFEYWVREGPVMDEDSKVFFEEYHG